MSYKSYYLYQKYQSIGGGTPTPVYPEEFSVDGDGTMPKVIKDENDVNCGAPSSGDTIYRWVDIPISSDYICDVCP